MKSVEINNLYVLNFLRIDAMQDRNWKLPCDYIFIFEGTTEKFSMILLYIYRTNFVEWRRLTRIELVLYVIVYEMLNNEDRVLCADTRSIRDFTAASRKDMDRIAVVIDLYSCRSITYILSLRSISLPLKIQFIYFDKKHSSSY